MLLVFFSFFVDDHFLRRDIHLSQNSKINCIIHISTSISMLLVCVLRTRKQSRENEDKLRQFSNAFSQKLSDNQQQIATLEQTIKEKDGKSFFSTIICCSMFHIYFSVTTLITQMEAKDEEKSQLDAAGKKATETIQALKTRVCLVIPYASASLTHFFQIVKLTKKLDENSIVNSELQAENVRLNDELKFVNINHFFIYFFHFLL